MFLLSTQQTAIIMLLICIIPIAVLILLAIILRVKNSIKKKENKSEDASKEIDEQLQLFLNVLGGDDNYLSSSIERNKITFKLKDVSLLDGEKLKELGASGVLIIGDEVRASFGDRSASLYQIIKRETGEK